MPPRKNTAAKKRATAKKAIGETNGSKPTVEWRGLTFTLTDNTGWLLFETETDLDTADGAMRFLRALLGEDQFAKAREKVSEEKLSLVDARTAVLNSPDSLYAKVAEALGASVGESQASDSS